MVALAFIGSIQHEIAKDAVRKLIDTIKTEAACDCLVVCNANGLFATASKLDEQLEMLFDSGIDLVMVGEQAISRNCCRSVFAKAQWPVIKALNLPGSNEKNSVKSIEQGGENFCFVSTVDGSGKVPVEHSFIKLDELVKNITYNSILVINDNGTDYRYLQALTYRYSKLKNTVLMFGSGNALATTPSLYNGNNCLLQCDVGSVVTENTIWGIDPEQWWTKNIERRPLTLLPKWGALHCDYTITWVNNGKIERFAAKSIRI